MAYSNTPRYPGQPHVTAPAPAAPVGGWRTPPPGGGYPGSRRPPGSPAPTLSGTKPGQGTVDQNDAIAVIAGYLKQFGLEDLTMWAWQQLTNNRSPNEIMIDLTNQQAYKDRFAGNQGRIDAGLAPLSPAEYIAYENTAAQLMRAAGFPSSFYDSHQDFTRFIANDVSVAELSQRVSIYQQAAYQVPAETRAFLRTTYGIGEGQLAAYFADPERALPILQQQFAAAQIGGEANLQHFGALSRQEAERLAVLGVTDQQAAQGFGQVYQARELFQALPGEGDGAPGRDAALGLVGGDAAATEAVSRQAAKRKAQFSGGGSFASTQQGLTGLGSAATT